MSDKLTAEEAEHALVEYDLHACYTAECDDYCEWRLDSNSNGQRMHRIHSRKCQLLTSKSGKKFKYLFEDVK